MPGSAAHPVAALLRARLDAGSRPGRRDDGARLALAIEGGGMRGVITGGMALALEQRSLLHAFDDVYGSSAGALNAAWFVAGASEQGLPNWTDPVLRSASIKRSNLLRRRPLVDGRHLTEVVYGELAPMPFHRVLESPVRFHPLATDAATGESCDLVPYVTDPTTLKLALRATTALPLLSGRPVQLGGRRWFDAGLSEAVPFRTAIAQGATHVLVLRSRRHGEQEPAESGRTARLVARYLERHGGAVADAFRQRPDRLLRDDEELARMQDAEVASPGVLSLRPAAGTPSIGRLERDNDRILAGLEAGVRAVEEVLV